jgi:hypothetical protein
MGYTRKYGIYNHYKKKTLNVAVSGPTFASDSYEVDMSFSDIPADYLVLAAGITFTLGYLIINQVILRLMILAGTGLYIWYYAVVADDPLWAAIVTSVTMGAANIIGLTNLLLQKSRWNIPRKHRDIYDKRFSHVPPADFRIMMKFCRRETLTEPRIVTYEGQKVTHLYYVISGDLLIEKLNERFSMPAGLFVGEIAYLTGRASSATTQLQAGSEVLIWDFDRLNSRSAVKPRFKLALEAMISRDLAMKVAVAVAPHSPDWDAERARQKLEEFA